MIVEPEPRSTGKEICMNNGLPQFILATNDPRVSRHRYSTCCICGIQDVGSLPIRSPYRSFGI